MEIEELQATWSELSDQLEKQKKLTKEIIMNMTQERYTNKFRTISTYETLGAVVCFATALFILTNFGKLDTWYLVLCGIFTLAFLLLMPVLVLRSLRRIKHLNIQKKSYKETLIDYARVKKNLLLLQQASIYVSFILMFACTAVFAKIFGGKDFFTIDHSIGSYVFMGVAIVFLFFFTRWGYGCYKSLTNSAENILKELE